MVDLLAVAPCTGNTLSKIASGITDTPVTMAVKSALRIGIPVVLCCATNDAMAASGPNLLRLLNTKNVYLVPLRQDDPVKKPVSLVADFTLLPKAIELALEGKQLQPVFLPPHTSL
ncbi:dipicolinic acid synthetase B subunit [Clostridium sp. CAG:1013]|nr:dipicolinic acid synthetase B subunit [Clostridium sp. CAG:1013]